MFNTFAVMRQLVGNLRRAWAHDQVHLKTWPKTSPKTRQDMLRLYRSEWKRKTKKKLKDFIKNSLRVAKKKNYESAAAFFCQQFPFAGNKPTSTNTQKGDEEEKLEISHCVSQI